MPDRLLTVALSCMMDTFLIDQQVDTYLASHSSPAILLHLLIS